MLGAEFGSTRWGERNVLRDELSSEELRRIESRSHLKVVMNDSWKGLNFDARIGECALALWSLLVARAIARSVVVVML